MLSPLSLMLALILDLVTRHRVEVQRFACLPIPCDGLPSEGGSPRRMLGNNRP